MVMVYIIDPKEVNNLIQASKDMVIDSPATMPTKYDTYTSAEVRALIDS